MGKGPDGEEGKVPPPKKGLLTTNELTERKYILILVTNFFKMGPPAESPPANQQPNSYNERTVIIRFHVRRFRITIATPIVDTYESMEHNLIHIRALHSEPRLRRGSLERRSGLLTRNGNQA